MTDNLEKLVEQNLKLSGAKKAKFVREARALQKNLALRQKQKKGKKCMNSK